MNINEPWEASIDWAPDFPRGSHVFDADGNEIATNVDGFQATLIAAAPELLEQLEALVDLVRKHETNLGSKAFAKAVDYHLFFAVSAIKKAKGE